MPTLRIYRVPYLYCGFRKAEIWLDGVLLGRVKNGETKEFEVPSGQHQFLVKLPKKTLEGVMEIPDVETLNWALNYIPLTLRLHSKIKTFWLMLILYTWLAIILKLCGVPAWIYSLIGLIPLVQSIINFRKMPKDALAGSVNIQRFYNFSPEDPSSLVRSRITTIFCRSCLFSFYFAVFCLLNFINGAVLASMPISNSFGVHVTITIGVVTSIVCLVGFGLQTLLFSEKFCQQCEQGAS